MVHYLIFIWFWEWPIEIPITPLWLLLCTDLNIWFWCLGGGVLVNYYVFQSAQASTSSYIICWRYSSQERPMKILPWSVVMHWCICAEAHPGGKVVSAVMALSSGRHCLLDSNSMVVTWRVLIGMCHKLVACNYMGNLWEYELVDANRVCPGLTRLPRDSVGVALVGGCGSGLVGGAPSSWLILISAEKIDSL